MRLLSWPSRTPWYAGRRPANLTEALRIYRRPGRWSSSATAIPGSLVSRPRYERSCGGFEPLVRAVGGRAGCYTTQACDRPRKHEPAGADGPKRLEAGARTVRTAPRTQGAGYRVGRRRPPPGRAVDRQRLGQFGRSTPAYQGVRDGQLKSLIVHRTREERTAASCHAVLTSDESSD